MLNIALFGTSADPPTAGHLAILEWLSARYDLVAVWASDNPFKQGQTPLEHRNSMLGLLIKETKLANIRLSEDLSDKRSLISVQKAQEIWGKDQHFTLVIGSDLLGQLPNWYHSQELFKLVDIMIISRPGFPINPEDLNTIKQKGGNYRIGDLQGLKTSSSAYRESQNEESITNRVKHYIEQAQLYVKRTS